MMKLLTLATAGLCCVAAAGAADARPRHHHGHRSQYAHRQGGYPVTIGYDDRIISGRTGLHRSDFGVMVPDGTSPNFVLTGRRSGSGLGASGLPGSNLDD